MQAGNLEHIVHSVQPVHPVQPVQIVQPIQRVAIVHPSQMDDAMSPVPARNPIAEAMLADINRHVENDGELCRQIAGWQEVIVNYPRMIEDERKKGLELSKAVAAHRKEFAVVAKSRNKGTFWANMRRHRILCEERDRLDSAMLESNTLLARMALLLEQAPVRSRMLQEHLRDLRADKCRLYQSSKAQFSSAERTQPPPARTPRPALATKAARKELTAGDILNTDYESFTLPTELGRFLGDLDRNKVAIALTGDSGAGKSHFAFELARLFSDEGFRTKFFCLEEGEGKLTQDKIRKYDISEDVRFAGTATLADVRRDAPHFDVLIVDSFNKLDVDASEFEKLRTDFPTTIFILVFQKATNGGMRGGSSILFNSAATIDVTKDGNARRATMLKSRYGTIGWVFDIDTWRIRCID